ncbi:MAG: hypothetical protein ABIF09_17500, partial [Gemmatimonadota bacterium]
KTNALLLFLLAWGQGEAGGQETRVLFPDRSLMPALLAGPRDPITSASLFIVGPNPNAYGRGVEVEVSIGTTLPILLLAGRPGEDQVVVGIEAAAFARFGLQLLERELIASDWVFAVPVLWKRNQRPPLRLQRPPREVEAVGLEGRYPGGGRENGLLLTLFSGPSPLGQFNGKATTQVGLSLQGSI